MLAQIKTGGLARFWVFSFLFSESHDWHFCSLIKCRRHQRQNILVFLTIRHIFFWGLGEYGSVYSISMSSYHWFLLFFCILFWTVTKFIDLGKGKAQITNDIHTCKDLFVRDIDFLYPISLKNMLIN